MGPKHLSQREKQTKVSQQCPLFFLWKNRVQVSRIFEPGMIKSQSGHKFEKSEESNHHKMVSIQEPREEISTACGKFDDCLEIIYTENARRQERKLQPGIQQQESQGNRQKVEAKSFVHEPNYETESTTEKERKKMEGKEKGKEGRTEEKEKTRKKESSTQKYSCSCAETSWEAYFIIIWGRQGDMIDCSQFQIQE